MYANYDYYKGTYLGRLIPEQDYARVALRADQYLDYYTRCRARDNAKLEAVKMAACALAEQYYEMDQLLVSSGKQSETVGSYSVTYRSAEDIQRIKLGLPNIAIIFILYRLGWKEAAAVSFVRIVAVSLLFGNPMTFAYSVAGGFLSLLVMTLLRKMDFLSTVGVSVAGGVMHNVGQILMAMLLLGTAELGYYLIVLAVTGTVSGIFVGLCGGFAVRRVQIR